MKKLILIFLIILFNLSEILSQCLPDGITFSTQAQIDSFQINYPNCSEIEGNVIIIGNDITNLNGLNGLTSIGMDLSIGDFFGDGNPRLVNLIGLENLTSIGRNLSCSHNDSLVNFAGLENLIKIEDGLWIHFNSSLKNLIGLSNVTTIEYHLEIGGNDSLESLTGLDNLTSVRELGIEANPCLYNLSNLSNLTQVKTIWIKDNPILESLEGLDNINTDSIETVSITSNENLYLCEVPSICNYIDDPDNYFWVQDNAIGCNTIGEVKSACQLMDIHDIINQPDLLIYPNPAQLEITILNKNKSFTDKLYIYNQIGQMVLSKEGFVEKIDVSNLEPGLYVMEFYTSNLKYRQKLIIK